VFHSLYLAASHVTAPLFALWQRRALRIGKEDAGRTGERWGRTERRRPDGLLVWFHAASVGETQSILPLIDALLVARADVNVLMTSTTRTSAEMLQTGLNDRVIHQMAPYDTVRASRAFLDHWRPDAAIWIESELWPRMLAEVGQRSVPRLLLNARVSARTARRWTRFAETARAILSQFDLIQAQEQTTMDALAGVGMVGPRVVLTGSLKQDRPPLDCDIDELARLRKAIGDRPVWCAASTHLGEEDIVLDAHRDIGGLLILVPRHTDRSAAIAELCKVAGFALARRSLDNLITPRTQVYIADTMGELGLWYRIAPVAFIGGSFGQVGGHNPYEAAQLDTAILHGPHVENFARIYAALDNAGAARLVTDAEELAQSVTAIDAATRDHMVQTAHAVLQDGSGATQTALDAILERL
jgi:3-deoxy-D-manno-octulosonic-acid transferase